MDATSKPQVFVSHITEESELAQIIKEAVARDFLGMVEVFVSSDNVSIAVGSKWLDEIDGALKRAQIEIILCSRTSVARPWVNFEAGAGWIKGIPVVPVCHTGMRSVDLPIPLNMLQAVQANEPGHLKKLYGLIARQLGANEPTADLDRLASTIKEFEKDYGLIREVADAVKALKTLLPDLQKIFVPRSQDRSAAGDVKELLLENMRPHLQLLQGKGMLAFSIGRNKLVFGQGGGNVLELKIEVLDAYYAIAEKVGRSS